MGTQGENTMDENTNWVDELSPEEKQQLSAEIDASREKILGQRNAAKLAGLQQRYEAERTALIARTSPGDERIRGLTELQARYRAQGLRI